MDSIVQVYNPMVGSDYTLAYQVAAIPNEQKQALALSFGRVSPHTKLIATGTLLSLAAAFLTAYALDIFKAIPKVPCNPEITAYRVILSGDCTTAQMTAAYEKSKQLYAEEKINLKAEGRRDADAYSKKIQDSIDRLTKEKDDWERDFNERQRRVHNPTPEEKAAQDREIDCLMDQKFLGWPGYEPKCLKHDFDILGATLEDNCSELKSKFRKLSVKYHPDKNNSTEAQQKFIDITNAYQKLCP